MAFDFSYGDGFCDAFGSVSLFFRLASVSWSFMIICCLFALLQGFTFHQICTSIKYQHFVVWTISICFPLIVLFSSPRPFSTEHYVIQVPPPLHNSQSIEKQTKNRNETGSDLSLGERLTRLAKRLSRKLKKPHKK